MRFLAVWLPNWPIIAAGYSPDTAVAVIESGRVRDCSPAAAADGVRIGQRRREAKTNSPELITLTPNPQLDVQEFEPLVTALTHIVPRLEVTEPGLCTMAAEGPARYYGSETELVAKLRTALDTLRFFSARIGIADSRFASRLAAAQGATGHLVPAGATKDFLAPFPITTLKLDELSTISHRLGIHTLGQFAQLPTRAVLTRFGSVAATAHAVARGVNPEPLAIYQPTTECAVEAELDPPAQRVDIATFAAKQLSSALMEMLARRGLGCTALRIEAQTDHAEEISRIWRASPVFDAETIVERVRWQLSGWLQSSDPTVAKPTAGISLLRLVADEVAGGSDLQVSLWGEMSQADRRAVRGLDRVRGLLGPSAVFTSLVDGGRSPADRVRLVPWGQVPPPLEPPMPWPGQIPEPMPTVIHTDPVPVDVCGAHGPVGITMRGDVSSSPTHMRLPGEQWLAITAWAGPWLADEQWWEPDLAHRVARFQLMTEPETIAAGSPTADAPTAHLCCVQQNSWWIEATYD